MNWYTRCLLYMNIPGNERPRPLATGERDCEYVTDAEYIFSRDAEEYPIDGRGRTGCLEKEFEHGEWYEAHIHD